MCNTGRACGYTKECECFLLRSGILCFVFSIFFCFLLINDGKEFICSGSLYQLLTETLIHQHGHQLGQNFKMCISSTFRSCNHEQQISRHAVHGMIVNTCRTGNGNKAGLFYSSRFSVRNGNSHSDCGGTLCFSCKDCLLESSGIIQVPDRLMKCNQLIDGLVLIRQGDAQLYPGGT